MSEFKAAVTIAANYTGASAVNKAKQDFGNLDSAVGKVTTGLKALVGAYAIQQTVSYVKHIIDLGDEMRDLSQKTGIGVQALSDLKAAAEDGGLGFESLETGLKKFSVNFSEAKQGVEKSRNAFNGLNISLKDSKGNFKESGDLILEVADKFKGLKDGPEKAALSVRLFGKAGYDMIPLLNGGREAIEGLGIEMDENFANRADEFNDNLNRVKRQLTSFSVSAVSQMLPALTKISGALVEFGKDSGAGSAFTDMNAALMAFAKGGITVFTYLTNEIDFAYQSLKTFGNYLAYLAVKANILVTEHSFKGRAQKFAAVEEQYLKDQSAIEDGYAKRKETRFKKLDEFMVNVDKKEKERTKNKNKGTDSELNPNAISDRYQKEIESISKWKSSQIDAIKIREQEIGSLGMSGIERKKLIEAAKIEAEVTKNSIDFTEDAKKKYKEAGDAVKAYRMELLDLEEQQRTSFGAGARQAMDEYLESAKDMAAQAKNLFGHLFQGIEDALVKFAQSGKLTFADLARSIEADLYRIAIKQAVISPLLGAVSAFASSFAGASVGGASGIPTESNYAGGSQYIATMANGGIVSEYGSVPLKKYAGGGIANTPQMALFGEGSMPEAYVPLPDGRSIPVSMKNAGGGNTSVVVNVNMTSGSEDAKSDTQRGKQIGQLISAAIKSELINQKRPGGLLA